MPRYRQRFNEIGHSIRRSYIRTIVLLVAACVPAPGDVAAAKTPHPAVVRIVVPENDATSYGSGTLIDVRDQYGLVITNWHVVRDASGPPAVVFPSGFRSLARPLKLDPDWDLAALVIWKPPVEPVKLADHAPRPGDPLTICGYGQGDYRQVSGQCTRYYAPRVDYPHELVELNVEARQGDSGGPIFNSSGELAGVLFGASQGTTLGSYGPRVRSFVASLAPDIGAPRIAQSHTTDDSATSAPPSKAGISDSPHGDSTRVADLNKRLPTDRHSASVNEINTQQDGANWRSADQSLNRRPRASSGSSRGVVASVPADGRANATLPADDSWLFLARNVLAIVGLVAILIQIARLVA